ncbi:hypothetical protein DL93DRAFT_2161386 [Clavulina sp. PMI_390]|nr:hypothetical protein DL93DRAFT_2161386 [Clavulina sp. PMI_390]
MDMMEPYVETLQGLISSLSILCAETGPIFNPGISPPNFAGQLWTTQCEKRLTQKAMELLSSRISFLKMQEARLNNALQPILKLPENTLGLIFSISFPVPEDAWPHRRPLSQKNEWTPVESDAFRQSVGLTCRAFYNTLCHTPQCWSIVPINVNGPYGTQAHSLEASLSRSKGLMYDLYIRCDETSEYAPPLQAHAAALRRHSHRCRSVFAHNLRNAGTEIAYALLSNSVPTNLSHLCIYWTAKPSWNTASIIPVNSVPTGAMPPIRSIAVHYDPNAGPLVDAPLDPIWVSGNTLTRLRLSGQPSITRLLQSCSSLEHLEWNSSLAVPLTAAAADPPILELPRLISLAIFGFVGACSLPPIAAPLLKQLRVTDLHDPNTVSPNTINGWGPFFFFRASQPRLPSLKRAAFTLNYQPSSATVRFLSAHPLLEELYMKPTALGQDFCQYVEAIINCRHTDSNGNSPISSSPLRKFYAETDTIADDTDLHASELDADFVVAGLRRLHHAFPDLQLHFDPKITTPHVERFTKELGLEPKYVHGRDEMWRQWPSAWAKWESGNW